MDAETVTHVVLGVGTFSSVGWVVYEIVVKDAIIRKKVKKQFANQTFYGFLIDLLETTADQWVIEDSDNEKVSYVVSTKNKKLQVKCVFHCDSEKLTLSLEINNEPFGFISFNRLANKMNIPKDYISFKNCTEEEKFKLNETLKHVKKIHEQLFKGKREDKEIKINEEKEILQMLLSQRVIRDMNQEKNGVSLKIEPKGNRLFLTCMIRGIVYLRLAYDESTSDFNIHVYNEDTKEAKMVYSLKQEFVTYIREVSKSREKTIYKVEEVMEEFQKQHDLANCFNETKKLLSSIKQDKEWLSMEQEHQLNETFSKDLMKLADIYESIRDKETVKHEVIEAIQLIEQKINKIKVEIEEKKKKELFQHKARIEAK